MFELTYFKRFDNLSDYINYIADDPILPNVSFVGEHRDVYYMNSDSPVPPGPTPVKEYLTFKVKSDGNIKWKAISNAKTISYSKDNGKTWEEITSNRDSIPTIAVNSGDTVLFKGNESTYNGSTFSGTTCQFNVEGNIMSLLYGDDFEDKTTLESEYTFFQLFMCCDGLVSAENLKLPATTLSDSCYMSMFQGCTSLTTAPELSATTLVNGCYDSMFNSCTSLTTAPELPATTLSDSCYMSMFQGCTSLTSAPELTATTLANSCYNSMFNGCTSLTSAPELPATTLANSCYNSMFNGCTGLTTAPLVLPATTLSTHCYRNMFDGCTSLTSAPELPATTLASGCYNRMFEYCTSLNYIKCLATDISAYDCTTGWVYGVAWTGTFVKSVSMSDWKTGSYGIPAAWTVEDA